MKLLHLFSLHSAPLKLKSQSLALFLTVLKLKGPLSVCDTNQGYSGAVRTRITVQRSAFRRLRGEPPLDEVGESHNLGKAICQIIVLIVINPALTFTAYPMGSFIKHCALKVRI